MGVVSRIRESLTRKNRGESCYYDQIRNEFLIGGQYCDVGSWARRAFSMFKNCDALIGRNKVLSFKELYARSIFISKILDDRGVKFRDKVILYCENSVEFYIFYYAVWLRGAVAVPINTFLHEKELAHVIKDSDASAILTTSSLKKKLDFLFEKGLVDSSLPMMTEEEINWEDDFSKLEEIEDPFVEEVLDPDELCLLLYTSGTTGLPKGVMLSSRNVISNTMQGYSRLREFSAERERFFAVLPLFHVFAQNSCIWLPLISGSSTIIVPKIDRRSILEGLCKKPTLFFGFPALFGLLCLMKSAPLASIKRFISGADAMPNKIRAAFSMIYGRKICAGYGLTEASPVVAINHDNENSPTYVVGRPLIGIECDIRDEEGKSLPTGSIGILWIRGENVMLGYHKAPGETEKVLKKGWLCTGDLASLDENGYLGIRGRSKDLIIHKGFNIYPQEVENILMTHPAVFKAAVIGRQEAVVGQVPVAFVATKEDKGQVEKALRELCSNNLARYKIPRRFICLDDLPMNATGKVDKKRLEVS